MITTGARLWFAVTAFALAAALVYFVATGRGEDGGAVTLLVIGAGAAIAGGAAAGARDGDAAVAGDGEREAVQVRSALPAPWPALGALGAGITIVGLATGGVLFYGGLGVIGGTLVEWMVQSWAERSTADPAYNTALRNRIMFPIEIPVLGFLGLGLVIITFSRVLLAVPSKNASTAIAIVVAVLIMAVASLFAARPRIPQGALAWLVAAGAVALLGAGIVSGVAGEREIEHHEVDGAHGESEGDHEGEDDGEGNAGTNDPSEGTVGDDGSHDDAEEPPE